MPVVVAGVLVVVAVAIVIWVSRPASVDISSDTLMGDPVPITSAAHVTDTALFDIQPGLPPAGGPHFVQWLRTGIYDDPQQDGMAIHSLEHGIVWFSYHPDLITGADLQAVRDVAREFSNDVILSPRPENNAPLYAVSWGRRLLVDIPVDRDLLREFVQTNRNRSPEPGVR